MYRRSFLNALCEWKISRMKSLKNQGFNRFSLLTTVISVFLNIRPNMNRGKANFKRRVG